VKIKENGMGKIVVCLGDRNICTGVFWKPQGGKLTRVSRLLLLINMKRNLELIFCDDTGRIYMALTSSCGDVNLLSVYGTCRI
jgi:hypothetical protein